MLIITIYISSEINYFNFLPAHADLFELQMEDNRVESRMLQILLSTKSPSTTPTPRSYIFQETQHKKFFTFFFFFLQPCFPPKYTVTRVSLNISDHIWSHIVLLVNRMYFEKWFLCVFITKSVTISSCKTQNHNHVHLHQLVPASFSQWCHAIHHQSAENVWFYSLIWVKLDHILQRRCFLALETNRWLYLLLK